MIVEAAFLLLAGGAVAGFGIYETRRRLRRWKEVAESNGLEVTESSGGLKPWILARDALGEVRIVMSQEGARPAAIEIDISRPEGIHQVTIRSRPPGSGPEIELGDLAFDSEFQILGPVQLVSALLGEETRRLLSLLHTEGWLHIALSSLRLNVPDANVGRALSLLLDLRRRLALPLDIPRRLAENARHDRVPGVRLHNLLLLIEALPEAPETAEAIEAVRSDPSPEVRLRAAIELGSQTIGRDLLWSLVTDLENDAASARAVSLLGDELSLERTRDILEQALSRHFRQTARACLQVIGPRGDSAAVEILKKVLDREHGDLAPVAARALGATGSPAAEPLLLQALERDQPEVREAATEALALIGSAASVLPLQEAADRFPHLRQAARNAVAAIQSRLQGASPGQLSLAATEAGQLSLADQSGQLSLHEGERDD